MAELARPELPRVVITGVGLTSPNGNDLAQYRRNLLAGVSGVQSYEIRHVGRTVAGDGAGLGEVEWKLHERCSADLCHETVAPFRWW